LRFNGRYGRLMFERVVLIGAPAGVDAAEFGASAATPGRLMFERVVLIGAPAGPASTGFGASAAATNRLVKLELSGLAA
jgi:hypothetical protein